MNYTGHIIQNNIKPIFAYSTKEQTKSVPKISNWTSWISILRCHNSVVDQVNNSEYRTDTNNCKTLAQRWRKLLQARKVINIKLNVAINNLRMS